MILPYYEDLAAVAERGSKKKTLMKCFHNVLNIYNSKTFFYILQM